MRTVGKGIAIAPKYRHVTTPVVRVRVLYRADYAASEWYEKLVKFTRYLVKDGKGQEQPATHFGPGAADVQAFVAQAWRSPHNFQLIVSPERAHGHRLPLQEYAEVFMQQVQQDLSLPLNWIGSCHYDTDEPHFQALLCGTSTTGHVYRIARPYISEHLRSRAAEVQAWYLGDQ
jgi:type IV secretory pathway VirD2 relaxase